MTEQEKREKAIEEMAHIVVTDCKNTCKNCGIYGWCIGFFNATRFYDADYRKAEEVRKETLKEAAKWLDEEKGFCGLGFLLLKHFGVEVEE